MEHEKLSMRSVSEIGIQVDSLAIFIVHYLELTSMAIAVSRYGGNLHFAISFRDQCVTLANALAQQNSLEGGGISWRCLELFARML